VALIYTVGTCVLFTVTVLVDRKPVPEMVIVSDAFPAGTVLGVIDWIVRGVGEVFCGVPAAPHPARGKQTRVQHSTRHRRGNDRVFICSFGF
jgi:hypothetical protein